MRVTIDFYSFNFAEVSGSVKEQILKEIQKKGERAEKIAVDEVWRAQYKLDQIRGVRDQVMQELSGGREDRIQRDKSVIVTKDTMCSSPHGGAHLIGSRNDCEYCIDYMDEE